VISAGAYHTETVKAGRAVDDIGSSSLRCVHSATASFGQAQVGKERSNVWLDPAWIRRPSPSHAPNHPIAATFFQPAHRAGSAHTRPFPWTRLSRVCDSRTAHAPRLNAP